MVKRFSLTTSAQLLILALIIIIKSDGRIGWSGNNLIIQLIDFRVLIYYALFSLKIISNEELIKKINFTVQSLYVMGIII